MMPGPPLLSIDLNAGYTNRPSALRRVSLEIHHGEILGLVGESGSGKSTIALAVMNLLGYKGGRASGKVLFRGRNLLNEPESRMRELRGRDIALVLQSPSGSLNPALPLRAQLSEAWRAHARGSKAEQRAAVERAMRDVSLPNDEEFLRRYPAQISLGQAQRVLIAMATMHSPALLVADEPTSALDVITQAEILKLIVQLNQGMGTAVLYISHDLVSVASICHRVAILYGGEIVECGTPDQVLTCPSHPYTRQLVSCVPWIKAAVPPRREEARISGPMVGAMANSLFAPASLIPGHIQ